MESIKSLSTAHRELIDSIKYLINNVALTSDIFVTFSFLRISSHLDLDSSVLFLAISGTIRQISEVLETRLWAKLLKSI